jgi:DNA helicase IV
MDYRDRLELISSWYVFPSEPRYDEYTNHLNAKKEAYFYYLEDVGWHTYVSSYINAKISDKKIIKYTNARRWYLKQNSNAWSKRTSIKIEEDKVIYYKKIDINESIWISVNKDLLNKKMDMSQNKVEINRPKWMGDISTLMIADQDKIMRSTSSWNVLITGVAGSGKTNVLLHRIDYLLSEHDKDFNQESFAFFCFNISLKKYVENMIHQKFNRIKVFSIDDFFQNECKKIFWIRYTFTNIEYDHKKTMDDIIQLIQSNIDNYLKVEYTKKEKTQKEKSFVDVLLGRWGKEKQEITYTISLDVNKISQQLNHNIKSISKDMFLSYYYIVSCIQISLNKQNPYEIDAQKIILNYPISNIIKEFSFKGFSYLFKENKIGIKHFNTSTPTFNYTLVDEVQDLQAIEIQILSNLSKKWMTLAWDVSQLLFQQNVTDLWTYFWIQFDEKYELKMSHRWSLQTIFFANQLLDWTNWIKAEKVNFLWEKPEIIISNDPSRISEKILELIVTCSEKWSVCIACSPKNSWKEDNAEKVSNWFIWKWIDTYYARKDTRDFSKKIHITNYMQIKWLEFDYVIVLNTNTYLSNEYEPWYRKNKRQVIYTVFTRAKQKLIIIDKWIGFFESFDSDSYKSILL